MSINIRIKVDFSRLNARIPRLVDAVERATRRALNTTAQDIVDATRKEMLATFDRPTPGAIRGFKILQYAKRGNLRAQAGLEDFGGKGVPPAKFLRAQYLGGPRRLKRYEVALVKAGLLPAGYFTVPGAAAKQDRYGNILGSVIVEILSDLRAFSESGFRANRLTKAVVRARNKDRAQGQRRAKFRQSRYFVVMPGKRAAPGIYRKTAERDVDAVLLFVRQPSYRRAIDLETIATRTVNQRMQKNFDDALAFYLHTAQ